MPDLPSKHAGSDSHLIRICWEALARSGPDCSSTPACFRTGTVWPQPDIVSQNPIESGPGFFFFFFLWFFFCGFFFFFFLHYKIRAVCERTQPSRWETGGGPVTFRQKQAPIILAHRLASGRDAFAQNLTRLFKSAPDRLCTK